MKKYIELTGKIAHYAIFWYHLLVVNKLARFVITPDLAHRKSRATAFIARIG